MDYKVDFKCIDWEEPIEGMRCKIKKQQGKQLRLVEYSRDMEPHWCENGHIGLVLKGKLEIKFDGETCLYGPGDGIFIPSGEQHRHMGRIKSDNVRVFFVEDV